jgi:hypothetical protein
VQVDGRGDLGPSPAPGEEGPGPHRAGAWPPQACGAVPVVGRQRCGGAVLASVWSCSMPRPHGCCTIAWGRAATWFVSFESS